MDYVSDTQSYIRVVQALWACHTQQCSNRRSSISPRFGIPRDDRHAEARHAWPERSRPWRPKRVPGMGGEGIIPSQGKFGSFDFMVMDAGVELIYPGTMGVDPTAIPAIPYPEDPALQSPSAMPPSDTASRSAARSTVSAGTVRRGLRLTPHQLGEYTRNLGLAVGDRPNYPRYGLDEAHSLVAVQALRELQIPVDDACRIVQTLHSTFVGSRGWLVLYPDPLCWVAVPATAVDQLTSLLALTGRAAVIDLETLRERSRNAWLHLITAPADD